MIGIGNGIGEALQIILLLSAFSLIIIPAVFILGFKKTKLISKLNGTKKISILILLYFISALLGHLILLKLITFGFYYGLIWTSTLLLLAIYFNLIMYIKTKNNNTDTPLSKSRFE